ncbi:MAG: hypothetical protein WAL64_07790 [Candidatus Dormiibacterota bacterium]
MLVARLPQSEFRLARPNDGYLIAAALLREGVLSTVLSLNFDLAMTTALTELCAYEVDVIAGPAAHPRLGGSAVVYLHRNVDEPDPELWILRTEALADQWQDQWEDVVVTRVVSSPAVVFAGLGSPAGVLTKTVARVRGAVGVQQHQVYVVDPEGATAFEDALSVSAECHIQMSWCEFMRELSGRVVEEFKNDLSAAGTALCSSHNWVGEVDFIPDLVERLHKGGLVDTGRVRAAWLLESQSYATDEVTRRNLIADLVLGVGLVERRLGRVADIRPDGVVELKQDGQSPVSFLAASGAGTLRWTALEPKVLDFLRRMPTRDRPHSVLLSAMPEGLLPPIAAPKHLVGSWDDDITQGAPDAQFLTVDEVRSDPGAALRLVG